MPRQTVLLLALVAGLLSVAVAPAGAMPVPVDGLLPAAALPAAALPATTLPLTSRPLAGVVVAIDPGHQLGAGRHPRQINRKVWVGFWKACDTTGTATASGYPEATFTWDVSRRLQADLSALGARVLLSRSTNSDAAWGPCIDERGRLGNAQHAALKIVVHADGAPPSGHGFHVIAPGRITGYTDDIAAASDRLARAVKAGLVADGYTPSTYIPGGGIVRRTDLGTLRMADIPSVLTELGNMANPADATQMRSPAGRQRYADALLRGIRSYLDR